MNAGYEMTVGLEAHVQLMTRTKLFCPCATAFAAQPNTCICPVCLGYPGSLPRLNRLAVEKAVSAGLALGCEISALSSFDRKNYFYPDAAKNYQVTQYHRPLCRGGTVALTLAGGAEKIVRLRHAHIEEDVARCTHHDRCSGVDFNRAGVPLLEIVTCPDIASPDEAAAFLTALRQILRYAAVSECNLEEGNLRCDVNVSVRPRGAAGLGERVELKNLNTISGTQAALVYERERQAAILDAGGRVAQETRRWDADAGVTRPMRAKENAPDYRCFPEPDVPPLAIAAAVVECLRQALPEAPAARRRRLAAEYQLPDYDAGVLTAEKPLADFFEKVARLCGSGKAAANWIMTDVLRLVALHGKAVEKSRLDASALAELITLVAQGKINGPTAKDLLGELFADGGRPGEMVAARGLAQVNDAAALHSWVAQAVAGNAATVADWIGGKEAAAGFLVGQVMKLSKGRADPKAAGRLVSDHLIKAKQVALSRKGMALESSRDIK